MKTYTVQELIEELNKIEDKSLEVYVRGDNFNIVPCQEVLAASADEDIIVLACHKEFDLNKATLDLIARNTRI